MKRVWLIVGLAAAVAAPAAASTGARNASGALCPQAMSQHSAEIMDRRLQALDERLQRMDETLQAQIEARTQVLEDTKAKIEAAVHRGDLTPEQIDSIVARAIDRASARARGRAACARVDPSPMKRTRRFCPMPAGGRSVERAAPDG